MQYSEFRRDCILELFFNCFRYQEISCLIAVPFPSFCNALLFLWQRLHCAIAMEAPGQHRAELDVPQTHFWLLCGDNPPQTHAGHGACKPLPIQSSHHAVRRGFLPGSVALLQSTLPQEIILTLNYHLFGFPMPRCLLSGWQWSSQKVRRMQPFLLDRFLPFRILCAVCTHRRDGEL